MTTGRVEQRQKRRVCTEVDLVVYEALEREADERGVTLAGFVGLVLREHVTRS